LTNQIIDGGIRKSRNFKPSLIGTDIDRDTLATENIRETMDGTIMMDNNNRATNNIFRDTNLSNFNAKRSGSDERNPNQ